MRKFEYGQKLKEIAGWAEPALEETPRQRTLRLFPHTMPSPELVEREKRRIGITSLGSPGVGEELLAWGRKYWPWIAGGTILYAGLLAATLRR